MMFSIFSDDEKALPYLREMALRLKGGNLVQNPFNGYILRIGFHYTVKMTAIYPAPWLFGLITLLPIIWFKGLVLTWWLLMPGLLLMASLAWTAPFFRFMFWVAMRKRGIDYASVSQEDMLEVMKNRPVGSIEVLAGCQEEE